MIFSSLWAKAQIIETFADSDLTTLLTWEGDLNKFIVENKELRSNSAIASDEYARSTESTRASDVERNIIVNMQFSTSGANYTDVFLISDSQNLKATTYGYYVRIGNTKDEVSLYKILNGQSSLVIDGTDNKTHNKTIAIKVIRSASGDWELWTDYTGGVNYALEGSANDIDINTSSYFGLLIKQSTASFHKKHFYDDIYVGELMVDKKPPKIVDINILGNQNIDIICDEEVDTSGATFNLDNGYSAPNQVILDGNKLTLAYGNPLVNDNYTLTIKGFQDKVGNLLDTTISFQYFEVKTPQVGDVIISELFPDPTPSFGLPETEFIEIRNITDESLQLLECSISDGGTPAVFPAHIIPAQSYLILTKTADTSDYKFYGEVLGVARFPTLNNSGDNIELRNANGELLDQINYNIYFYQDDEKEQGGYTLELIDIETECESQKNWTASNSTLGGTPGQKNSVDGKNPDLTAPFIVSVKVISRLKIQIILSEEISDEIKDIISSFFLTQLNTSPGSIEYNRNTKTLTLTFNSLIEKNVVYLLTIPSLSDYIENKSEEQQVTVVSTDEAEEGDIVINEILFNPLGDGVDYIELNNNLEKFLDLSELRLARYTDERTDIKALTQNAIVYYPNEYLVFTTDSNSIIDQYPTAKNIIQIPSLPPMNNDEGIVLLLKEDLNIIDSVPYTSDYHFDLLSNDDGVSLERINFGGESYRPELWHSARSSVGFGTPRYQNSQFIESYTSESTWDLVSKIISPENDGYQDLLTLNYAVQSGTVVNGYVFNLAGLKVSHIFNSLTLSTSGVTNWDGVLENGTKIPVGNYILLLETFDLEGKISRTKMAFSVTFNF